MDRDTFIRFVESNQRAVRRFLTALCCGDSATADDIAQDAFVKAYLCFDTLKEDDKIAGWIYRIAYNTFLSSRKSVRHTDTLDAARSVASADGSDKKFEYQGLYIALKTLTEKERSAILLHYMEGYSIKEIAAITDNSPEAVRQQLVRGRKHLKEIITD